MKAFKPYVDELKSLASAAAESADRALHVDAITVALDGQPAREIRRLVPLERTRSAGAFFTGSKLAGIALRPILREISAESTILDPACGVGDLLVACASRLPVAATLAETLSCWGNRLIGRDLHEEFVEASKARLVLAAIRRGVRGGMNSLPSLGASLPGIRRGCSLADPEPFALASHIVLNPPFTLTDAPHDCTWASGTVNSSALFMETCLRRAKSGTRVVAILPDVLRSGSRYREWREIIQARSQVNSVRVHGRFDRWADVDVFILDLLIRQATRGKSPTSWGMPRQDDSPHVGDYFQVSVGPVVDYRDPHKGPWFAFVSSRGLLAWQVVRQFPSKRRFQGRVISPPVVVVRRTSRPGDKHRAVGTVIAGTSPVAIENHLLVLTPKDGTLRSCRALLRVLKERQTTMWLNRAMRCRHLTVSSLSELPWWSNER